MKGNNFKTALKADVPNIACSSFNNSNKTNLLLSKLGLFPIPKNVQANISDDNKYLNLQLISNKNDLNNHLLFQLPLQENQFSYLRNRSDYQDLINRYYAYTKEYIDEIKDYALQERAFLQERFPI